MMILEDYIKQVAKELNEECGIAESVDGKRYRWSRDFEFTPDVVEDLRKRDLFGIGPSGIWVMVPVEREDAPTHQGKPYDILHISVEPDPSSKKFKVGRFYGCRDDWTHLGFHEDEKDWSAVPVLTKKTVDSLVAAYSDNGVFENMKANLEEYAAKHEKWLDMVHGRESTRRDLYQRVGKTSDEVQRKLDAWFERRRADRSTWSRLVDCCNAFIDGDYRNYGYEFEEPEEPSEEYVRDRLERHEEKNRKTADELSRYYAHADSNRTYTGD